MLAAAAVLFIVSSALVAFDGWPVKGFIQAFDVAQHDTPSTMASMYPGPSRAAALGQLAAAGVIQSPHGLAVARVSERIPAGTHDVALLSRRGHSGKVGSETSPGGSPHTPTTVASRPGAGASAPGAGSTGVGGTVGSLTTGVGTTVSHAGASLGTTVSGVTRGVGQVVGGLSPPLGKIVTQTGDGLGKTVTGLTGALGSTVSGAGTTLSHVLGAHG